MKQTKGITSVIDEAVSRATKLLAAAGVQYAILMADGSYIGTLPVGGTAKTAPRRRHNKDIAKATNWPAKLEGIKVGEVRFIDVGTKSMARKVMHSLSAGVVYRFGPGNSILSLTQKDGVWGVEVLVIDIAPDAPRVKAAAAKAA